MVIFHQVSLKILIKGYLSLVKLGKLFHLYFQTFSIRKKLDGRQLVNIFFIKIDKERKLNL